jgi:tRNA G46 methylase TrmB
VKFKAAMTLTETAAGLQALLEPFAVASLRNLEAYHVFSNLNSNINVYIGCGMGHVLESWAMHRTVSH